MAFGGKTKAQLRSEARVWLNDPRGTAWDDASLNTLLAIAYPLVVAVVESCSQHWNVSRARILVAVTSDVREYVFDDDYLVRRPVTVHRVEGVTAAAQVTADLGRTALNLRSFADQRSTVPYPQLESAVRSEGVYIYRSDLAEWVIGLEARQPIAQVLEISYVPTVDPLALDSSYPLMVPPDFHHLVGMRAAMIAKGTENRINETVFKEYALAEKQMKDELSSLQAHKSRRF